MHSVYPVPDGDIRTNMHLTLQSVRGSQEDQVTMEGFARALSHGSMSARGTP